MAEPTLTEIFGAGATQDANSVTIQKSALTAVGLTSNANNRAEAIFAALILLARQNLSETNFGTNIDQNIYITTGFSSFANRGTNNDQYRTDQLNIVFAKLDTQSTFDPDDY